MNYTPIRKEYSYDIGSNPLVFSEKKHSIYKEFNKIKKQSRKDIIFKGMNNYDFSNGFDGIEINQSTTNNNHIIPCSYFARWTKFLTRNGELVNKKTKARLNKITYKGKNTNLNNFMQIDYAFMNILEDMFNEGGSEKCKLRDRLQYFIEEKYITDISFILFREFDGKKFNCDNRIKLSHPELTQQINETKQDFCKRKSDVERFVEYMNIDSFLGLNFYVSMFYARQKSWNILSGNSVKNILEEIIKEYQKTKSFDKYKSVIYSFHQLLKKTMFKNCESKYLIHGCDLNDKENTLKFLKEFLKYAEKNKITASVAKRINSVYMCDLALNVRFDDMFIYMMSTDKILSVADFPMFKSKKFNVLYLPLSPNLLLFTGDVSKIISINLLANENKQQLIDIYEKELSERKDCEIIKLKE